MKRVGKFHLIFAVAALIYGAGSSIYPFPGESTALLVSHGWVYPFQLLSHSLWGMVIWILDRLPFSIGATANIFSVFCGAASIALFHQVLMNCTLDSDYDEKTPNARPLMAGAGAFYLMLLLPTWTISNRAHYASFEMLMLLGTVRLLQQYCQRGGRARLFVLGVLLGLGLIESSSMLVAAPVMGLYLIYLMWKNSDWAPAPIALASLGVAAGLLFFVIPTLLYMNLPVYEWGGARNIFHALWLTYSSSARNLSEQIRQVGWIVLVMVSLIPYVGAMWMKKSQPVENRQISLMFVSLTILGLCATILFNVRIAPWIMLPSTIGLVLSEVLIATAFALSVAFWFATFKYHRKHRHARGYVTRGIRVELVFGILLSGLLITGAAMNLDKVRPQGNRELYRVAQEMVRGLPPRDTVVTFSGTYDKPLTLAAHDLGIDCRIINANLANLPLYRNYIKDYLGSTRLASLAEINFMAMLREWMSETPQIHHQLALHGNPRVWESAGYRPTASRGLYYGIREEIDVEELYESQQAFWRLAIDHLSFNPDAASVGERITNGLAFDISRNINDLGVFLEFSGRPDLAEKAYSTAYSINRNNVSVVANLYSITSESGGNTEELRERIAQLVKQLPTTSAQLIMDNFGYIRRDESFRFLSEVYQSARHDEMSSEQIDPEDADIASEEDVQTFVLALEKIQARELEEAQVILRELVRKAPKYNKVWIMKGIVSYRLGDYESLQRCIERMLNQGEFWPQLGVVMGQAALENNDVERARNAFEAVLMTDPTNIRVLEELLKLDASRGISRRSEVYLSRLLGLDSGNFIANFVLGHILYMRGNHDMALEAYMKAAERNATAEVLNNIAWLQHMLGDNDAALDHVRRSVEINRELSSTWNTMASIFLARGELQQAEYSVLTSLRLNEANPGAKVTLVGIEMARGNEERAMELARDLRRVEDTLTAEQDERLKQFLQH